MSSNIEVLGNLTAPITKLIELFGEGIGALALPWQIRRVAKAKGDELKILALADAEARQLVRALPDEHTIKLIEQETEVEPSDLVTRATARLDFQSRKRQRNLESIAISAMNELPDEVSDEPVDPDWIARFFNAAQDVSTEEMRLVWARVLAREVTAPGSFSLRSLENLKNMVRKEAELFRRMLSFVVEDNFVPGFVVAGSTDDPDWRLTFEQMLKLQEIGLLVTGGLTFFQDRKTDASEVIWRYLPGGTFTVETSLDRLKMKGWKLSEPAVQLSWIAAPSSSQKFVDAFLDATRKVNGVIDTQFHQGE